VDFIERISELFFGNAQDIETVKAVIQAGPVVKGVILILLFFSVVSWGIIIYKFFVINAARYESNLFLDVFWTNKRLSILYEEARRYRKSPIAQVFRAGYLEFQRVVSAARLPKSRSDDLGNPVPRDAAGISAAASATTATVRSFFEERFMIVLSGGGFRALVLIIGAHVSRPSRERQTNVRPLGIRPFEGHLVVATDVLAGPPRDP